MTPLSVPPTSYCEELPSGSPDPNGEGNSLQHIYIDQIRQLRDNESTTLYVDFTHVLRADDVLASAITEQYIR